MAVKFESFASEQSESVVSEARTLIRARIEACTPLSSDCHNFNYSRQTISITNFHNAVRNGRNGGSKQAGNYVFVLFIK